MRPVLRICRRPGLLAPGTAGFRPDFIETSDAEACERGYSSSRTCEIGVSMHSGIHYQSIAYLVDEAAAPQSQGYGSQLGD
jgi:hypothetical protein